MPAPRENQTVGQLIARMRRMLGHLGPRDRQTVTDGVEAILELSTRLHEATHQAVATGSRRQLVITKVDDTPDARGGTDN